MSLHCSLNSNIYHRVLLQRCCVTARAPRRHRHPGRQSARPPAGQPAALPAQQWRRQQEWRAQVLQTDHRSRCRRGLVVDAALTLLCCSKSSGSAAFIGLTWTCKMASSVFSAPEKREGAAWKKLVSGTLIHGDQSVEPSQGFTFHLLVSLAELKSSVSA